MKNIFEALLICFAVLFLSAASVVLADDASKDVEKISISELSKNRTYSPFKDVVLSGSSIPNKEIIIFLDDKIALSESDENGNWKINLGTLLDGNHNLQLVTESSENIRTVATTQIIVKSQAKIRFFAYLAASLSSLFDFTSPAKIELYPRTNSFILQKIWG